MIAKLIMQGLQGAALLAIRAYQRFVSPYKGFSCAFRAHTGRQGCSAYGHRVIGRFGLRRGLALLDRRLADCGQAHRLHRPQAQAPHAQRHGPLSRQGGFCDLPCDLPSCDLPSCDLPGGKFASNACDVLSCGCDLHDLFGGRGNAGYAVDRKVKEKYKRNRRD